nr:hypothetical protein [Tanacetum cinerariifolium]
EDLSDIGSLGVDGLPMMSQDPYTYVEAALQAPPSPDYVPGPEHIPSRAYVPEYVSKPVYQEFMPLEDDSNLEEDPEEDDEDPEEDPTYYPNDRDDEDEKEESSRDEADDKEEDKDEDEEEEEEHPALANSIHHLYTVADYGFVGTLDDEIRRDPESEDTDEIYGRLDDAHNDRLLMSGQLNMLHRDRHTPHSQTHGDTVVKDCRIAGSRLHMTVIVSRGTDSAKDAADTNGIIAETACHTRPR